MTDLAEQVVKTHLITETKKGTLVKNEAILKFGDGRIEFLKSPFSLKDEIKAMKGSKWGGVEDPPRKSVWIVDDCPRNRFQLRYLMGENPYDWFDRPLQKFEYDRPLMTHQCEMSDYGLTYHYSIWAAEMGVGKGGVPSSTIYTPRGTTTYGEVKVGDEVINPEGKTCRVTGVFPRGKMEMFKTTMTDGSSVIVSGDHLWRVITPSRKHRGQDWEVLETQELVKRGLTRKNGKNGERYNWYIPMVEPVEFDPRHLDCHPYVMGYLLGNGHLPQYRVSVPDQETVDRLNSFMSQPLDPISGGSIDYVIRCQGVRDAIDSYGLKECRANSKFVPKDFLFNMVENRLYLLQGLLDSDGTPNDTSGVEFCSASDQLASDMVFLIQSFGGTCHRGLKEEPTYTYKGETLVGQSSHRINGSFHPSTKPFLLTRKAGGYTYPTKYEPTRAIISVESVGEEECICIRVDSDTHCYVTDDFIVTHNTLSAIEVIEKSGVKEWYWLGPKSALPAIKREFKKWNLDESINVQMLTYTGLVRVMDEWKEGQLPPGGVIFDECSRLKTESSQRTRAAQFLADLIRHHYGTDGYVIEMSGTPSPKRPTDWWSLAEIAWPGFLKEGSPKSLEQRLAFLVDESFDSGTFKKRVGWKDNENKCAECGMLQDHPDHQLAIADEILGDIPEDNDNYHEFVASKNEVAYMFERLNGLVLVKHKKDCLELPEKRYRKMVCKPTASIIRVAQAITHTAPNAMQAATLLRELSDGFQYRDVDDGFKPCDHCEETGMVSEWYDPEDEERTFRAIDMLDEELQERLVKDEVVCPACGGEKKRKKYKRITREVPCPKEAALEQLLDENSEQGRIVVFAGFTGSVDRCVNICLKNRWDVVRCDGRGFQTMQVQSDGEVKVLTREDALEYWSNLDHERVAFVSHPESGGMGLTLTEASTCCFWSNSFKPEYRTQAEDRIHRKGMDENRGATIVDLIHLPTDEKVLLTIRENRKLELMTMGEIEELLVDDVCSEGGEIVEV